MLLDVRAFAFLVAVASVWCEKTPICDPATIKGGPVNITLPNKFFTLIETTIKNEHKTLGTTLFYDNARNLVARQESDPEGNSIKQIWDFSTMQKKTIQLAPFIGSRNQCKVSAINPKTDSIMFDWHPGLPVGNAPNAKSLLAFDGNWDYLDIQPQGPRGIKSIQYTSCKRSLDQTLTYELTLDVSDPDWNVPYEGIEQIPLQLTARYNPPMGGTGAITVTYNFIIFRPSLQYDVFQAPQGVFCAGAKPPPNVRLPRLPRAFSYRVELVDPVDKAIDYMSVWYDSSTLDKLFRIDYKAVADSRFGANVMSEVHEFQTGLAYVTDVDRGNCSVIPIPKDTQDDTKQAKENPMKIALRTPEELFGLDKIKPSYGGTTKLRGVMTNMYVAVRNDWPKLLSKLNTTIVWYFAKKDWKVDPGTESGNDVELEDLMRMDIYLDMGIDIGQTFLFNYNFYEFNQNTPDYTAYDIHHCFTEIPSDDVIIVFDGTYSQVLDATITQFKTAIMEQIQSTTGITAARVSNQRIYYDNQNVTVRLTLFGKPDVQGDVDKPLDQPTLKDIKDNLRTAIRTKGFSVTLVLLSDLSQKTMRATDFIEKIEHRTQYNYITDKPPIEGMQGGAVGGIAVGCLFGGALVGIIAVFVLEKLRGPDNVPWAQFGGT